jgi:hypothetical protein
MKLRGGACEIAAAGDGEKRFDVTQFGRHSIFRMLPSKRFDLQETSPVSNIGLA